MDSRFCAEPSEYVLALEFNRGALDARHFPGRDFDQFRFQAVLFTPSKIHAQQHLRPILGLGSSRTRLDIEKRITGVHLAREHPTKFKLRNLLGIAVQIPRDGSNGFFVAFLGGHLQQIGGVLQPRLQLIQYQHDSFEISPFLTQGLRALLVLPNVRIFEFALDLYQAIFLFRVVKDTP